jgi:CRP/FNR family transcriptional regulator, anaerobic regulatory protein
MEPIENIKKQLSFLHPKLAEEILNHSSIKEFAKGTRILSEDQYIKVVPIVLEGLVKVYSVFGERELLLYYIEPTQSCVMSFSAALANKPGRVYAVTEEDSKILLLPVHKLSFWIKHFPDFNELFYHQYDLRYSDLLETIEHLLINRMDKRLLDYLKQKSLLTNQNPIKISHVQIANELGTAREVITRIIKKLETEGLLIQNQNGIKIIEGQ